VFSREELAREFERLKKMAEECGFHDLARRCEECKQAVMNGC